MAQKIQITYQDGRTEVVPATPRAQVMTEEYIGGFSFEKKMLGTFYLGWASLNRAGKETRDFETWLDLIDDVVDAPEEEAPEESEDPTQPAPSDDASSA